MSYEHNKIVMLRGTNDEIGGLVASNMAVSRLNQLCLDFPFYISGARGSESDRYIQWKILQAKHASRAKSK